MTTTLRDALLKALKQPRYIGDGDGMGVLHFLGGWLSVQPEKDIELMDAIKAFTYATITPENAAIAAQTN